MQLKRIPFPWILIRISFLPFRRIKKRTEIISCMIITQVEINPARGFSQIPVSRSDDSFTDWVKLPESFCACVNLCPYAWAVGINLAGIKTWPAAGSVALLLRTLWLRAEKLEFRQGAVAAVLAIEQQFLYCMLTEVRNCTYRFNRIKNFWNCSHHPA